MQRLTVVERILETMVERSLETVLEKISALDRVKRALQKMEESVREDHPRWQGRGTRILDLTQIRGQKGKGVEFRSDLGPTQLKSGVSAIAPPQWTTSAVLGGGGSGEGSRGSREVVGKPKGLGHRLEVPVFIKETLEG
ncbi:hypothetical protein L484_021069 [Morus notabilis]|uniref:Uncharacterized protein n=1 Tax=Morus notabilis TaxID=981085 RepID=W9R9K2_9ROSA|nr:hypothetical protein L484_021069 [Morus notabilis]